MISNLEISTDVLEAQPGRLEFTPCLEWRLIGVMRTSWVAAGAENVNGEPTHCWSKFHHTDI